mmetsp:Transcript_11820/g.30183  ORF Transcript_11820/g.30183 Transcript_11820/m.30183 type:complete len:409 (+) Transcript_11820:710-1936(+)
MLPVLAHNHHLRDERRGQARVLERVRLDVLPVQENDRLLLATHVHKHAAHLVRAWHRRDLVPKVAGVEPPVAEAERLRRLLFVAAVPRKDVGTSRKHQTSLSVVDLFAGFGVNDFDLAARHREADGAPGVHASLRDVAGGPRRKHGRRLGQAPAIDDLQADRLEEVFQVLGQRAAAAHHDALDVDLRPDATEDQLLRQFVKREEHQALQRRRQPDQEEELRLREGVIDAGARHNAPRPCVGNAQLDKEVRHRPLRRRLGPDLRLDSLVQVFHHQRHRDEEVRPEVRKVLPEVVHVRVPVADATRVGVVARCELVDVPRRQQAQSPRARNHRDDIVQVADLVHQVPVGQHHTFRVASGSGSVDDGGHFTDIVLLAIDLRRLGAAAMLLQAYGEDLVEGEDGCGEIRREL